jgi:hypothetical protein
LGIGAQRAGTTWLARNLSRHPDVWTPPLKELHYFDQRLNEPSIGAPIARLLGREYSEHTGHWYSSYWRRELKRRLRVHRNNFDLHDALWDFRFFARSPSARWYASLFEPARGRVAGEITPEYSILDEEGVAHIHSLMPDARILFLMRNPIERDYSGVVKHLYHVGTQGEATTDEALSSRFGGGNPSRRGDYLQILKKWQLFYPADQIFVGFIEDIHFHPVRLLRHVYRFLAVDPSFAQKALKGKVNARSPQQMPGWVATHLARRYHKDLELLSERFGGYASFWLYCAERLANDPIDEQIAYPLWNSWLWKEWKNQASSSSSPYPRQGRVQSGALA